MAGPDRSEHRQRSPERKIKPPRPSNPWILYRSAKFAAMREALVSPVTQGNVSRQIATMWKNEPEDVRRYWERAAEQEKTRHQELYPDYHYQPQKREDKQREKKERKQTLRKQIRRNKTAKARASDTNASPPAPAPSPSPVPQLPATTDMVPGLSAPVHAPAPYSNQYLVPNHISGIASQNHSCWPESRYDPCGPSPPMSAAPSPMPSPDLRSRAVTRSSSSPSTHPSPGSESQSSSSSQLMFYQPPHPNSQNPSPNAFATQPLPPLLFHSSPPVAENIVASTAPVWNNQLPVFDPQSREAINFNIPISQDQAFADFHPSIPDNSSFASLQELLGNPDGNSFWHYTHAGSLVSVPQGNFDIGTAPQVQTVDYNNQMFIDWNYTAFEQQSTSLPEDKSSFVPPTPLSLDDIQSLFHTPNNPEIQAHILARQRQHSVFTQEMIKSMDLEAAEAANTEAASASTTLVPALTTVAPQQVGFQNDQHVVDIPIFTQVTNTPTVPSGSSYVPPAGAIYSSTRRVAASWKPPLASPLQMDEPTQAWSSDYTN